MMLNLGPIVIDVDIESTQRFYMTQPLAGIDEDNFQITNYIKAIEQAMNKREIETLVSWGIDPLRIARVSYMFCLDGSTALYDCIAFVIGDILEYRFLDDGTLQSLSHNGINLCVQKDREAFYNIGDQAPERAIQLNYQLYLPWVLPQPPE